MFSNVSICCRSRSFANADKRNQSLRESPAGQPNDLAFNEMPSCPPFLFHCRDKTTFSFGLLRAAVESPSLFPDSFLFCSTIEESTEL